MKRAFSLTEILVVIACICVAAAITAPLVTAAKLSANQAKAMATLRQIGIALSLYRDRYESTVDYGTAPAMAFPPDVGRLNLPADLFAVRGNNPQGSFTQLWDHEDFVNPSFAAAFGRYVEKYESAAVVVYADHFQPGSMPKSLSWSTWQGNALTLSGSTFIRRKIGFIKKPAWFHDE